MWKMIEKLGWCLYSNANTRRKAKEDIPKLFKVLNDIRRHCGYIKQTSMFRHN